MLVSESGSTVCELVLKCWLGRTGFQNLNTEPSQQFSNGAAAYFVRSVMNILSSANQRMCQDLETTIRTLFLEHPSAARAFAKELSVLLFESIRLWCSLSYLNLRDVIYFVAANFVEFVVSKQEK